jgi:hypothetical protein
MAELSSVSAGSTPAVQTLDSKAELGRTVLRVAWLSIVLGLALEVLLVILRIGTGTAGAPQVFIADLAQKVSWSFIVCVGLALGTAAGKARSSVMGLLGAISGPLGFTVARSVHKSVQQALSVAGPAVAGAAPFLIGGLKGLQYAALGAVLGWISRRPDSRIGTYLGAGAAVGVVFGSLLLMAHARAATAPIPAVDMAARGINEVIFPIGCALVLYAAQGIGSRFT